MDSRKPGASRPKPLLPGVDEEDHPRWKMPVGAQELHDSIEHPGLSLAQSGRFRAKASHPS